MVCKVVYTLPSDQWLFMALYILSSALVAKYDKLFSQSIRSIISTACSIVFPLQKMTSEILPQLPMMVYLCQSQSHKEGNV